MQGNTAPRQDRERLGFRQAVLHSFRFLCEYGFEPVQEETTLVRYQSATSFVTVYHGRASYEIGVEVGRLDRPEKYGLTSMIAWAGKEVWEAEGFGHRTMFQTSSREGVEQLVPKVADLVKRHGDSFLRGDPDFFKLLAETGKLRAAEYVERQEIQDVRRRADAAWSEKDFRLVKALYSSIFDHLTDVEVRRLRYANKQVPNAGFGSAVSPRKKC